MRITLQDATLSLGATDGGERANIGALFQVLSAHQGKFSVTIGDRVFPLNQKAEDVATTFENTEDTRELAVAIAEGAHIVDVPPVGDEKPAFILPIDEHDEHLLSVAEGEGMIAPEPNEDMEGYDASDCDPADNEKQP